MSDHPEVGFEYRDINGLPYPRLTVVTANIFFTAWKLLLGRALILSPSLMRYDFLRFLTLLTYPREAKPGLISIAVAGFYHDGNADTIICYECGLSIRGITASHNPLNIHSEKSPNCDFLRRNAEKNRRCFKRTDSENNLLQNFDNIEELTLDDLSNSNGNSIELIGDDDTEEQNVSLSSEESSGQSTEDYFVMYNENPLLPFPNSFHERQPLLMTNDYQLGMNVRILDEDLNVLQPSSYELRRQNSDPNVQNEQETSLVGQSNNKNETGLVSGENENTGGFQGGMLPRARNGETELSYNYNDQEHGNLICNEQQFHITRIGNASITFNTPQNIAPSYGQNKDSNEFSFNIQPFNPSITFFNKISSLMTGNTQQETLMRNFAENSIQNSSYVQRLQSFRGWPKGQIVEKKDLAAAGFSYTGNDDNVRCFQCCLELSQWQYDDDPFLEHVIHSRTCLYVRKMLGSEFIQAVTENNVEEIEKYKSCLELTTYSEMSTLSNVGPPGTSCNSGKNPRNDPESLICKVCEKNTIFFVFCPCGDVACRTCSNSGSVCPRCRQGAQERLKLNL